MHIIVQAGGRGSRLRHHTWNKPKCLVSVRGKPLLYHLFDKFKKHEWWECFLVGDDKIDTSKVVPATEYIGDLDQETRMTIDKMMFEQRMKEKANPDLYKR